MSVLLGAAFGVLVGVVVSAITKFDPWSWQTWTAIVGLIVAGNVFRVLR